MSACDEIEEIKIAGKNEKLTSIKMTKHEVHEMYHTSFSKK